METIFIYLDDERDLPHFWEIRLKKWNIKYMIFRKATDLMRFLKENSNKYKIFISFDHDLGYGATGYDVARYIVENNISIKGFTVHSMNPVGAENIINLLTHYGYHKIGYAAEIQNT